MTTFIISVLKVLYQVTLVFSKSNFFINKNSKGRKLSGEKKILLAVIQLYLKVHIILKELFCYWHFLITSIFEALYFLKWWLFFDWIYSSVLKRPKKNLLGSSLAFSLKENPVRCAKVCDKSLVILKRRGPRLVKWQRVGVM